MAAAAYAALVSLMHVMDQIQHHARHSILFKKEQIESLRERVIFLVNFLERGFYGDIKEAEELESPIADVAHSAEDIIESKVVDHIHDNRSTSFEERSSNPFCQELQGMIDVMDLMKEKATKIKEMTDVMDLMKEKATKIKEKENIEDQQPKDSIPSNSSSSSPADKNIMVGFDDVLIHIMDRLTGQEFDRVVIPIYGMGGIGKTTLARNIYENTYIVNTFDIRAWVTISQEYEMKEILLTLMSEFGVLNKEKTEGMNESQLGEQLHKYLFGRKYLIVMDDMWSIDVWEKVRLFLPDNCNASRIMITTRLSNMASHLGSRGLEMKFLDEEKSWNLLREKVFGQQKCSLELEEIGKNIAKNCKGLPLSIVVIAGLLSNLTREYWDHVAKQVNSIVSLANDGHCSKILSLSYTNLPVHLKPCFLYMGVFPEDHEIHVSKLIKLWDAEGFLKPNKAKSFEEVAEEYLTELIDKNLIMVHRQGSRGRMKTCKVHDLLRDLCLKVSLKEKFFCAIGARSFDSSQVLHNHRRFVIDVSLEDQMSPLDLNNMNEASTSLARSITSNTYEGSPLIGCRLIRVLSWAKQYPCLLEDVVYLVNLRYLSCEIKWRISKLPSSVNLLWNLHTLIVRGSDGGTIAPPEIWEMKQLKHLKIEELHLPIPPPCSAIDGQENSNWENLQTLSEIYNLMFSEEVLKRIQNIKKLQILYEDLSEDSDKGIDYCLNNLHNLQKIESLSCRFRWYQGQTHWLKNLIFPHSLKKLTLYKSGIPWECMTIIGSLPNLEVLKLKPNSFSGQDWDPIEGQFLSLKFLEISKCVLRYWNADSIHFPRFEQLFISEMLFFENIPLGIGDIPTLRLIKIEFCHDSVVRSAIDILDEQESLGNDAIQVQVSLPKDTYLKNLEASYNFKFAIFNWEFRDWWKI